MTNFRLFQTERVCRRQFQILRKWQKALQMGSKHWKKEKLLYTSDFSFSHSVLKRLVLQTCKNQALFGKGLKRRSLKTLFENIVGKGDAGIQRFLLFPRFFLTFKDKHCHLNYI